MPRNSPSALVRRRPPSSCLLLFVHSRQPAAPQPFLAEPRPPQHSPPMPVYTRILVPLEHSSFDVAILEHVRPLARLCGASVTLIHVADGWVARNIGQVPMQESEEMRRDREYLEASCHALTADGFECDAVLASGDPADEILAAAERERCDLIAMATHGHRFLADVVYGSVAEAVRHRASVPVLLVRGRQGATPTPARALGAVPPPA
jgi:nucleotide-binding universal stress UspA family protein